MIFSVLLALLGILSLAPAVVLPERQAPTCHPTTTVTNWVYTMKTFYVTVTPATVTVAAVDTASVASQFASASQVDAEEVTEQGQLAPVSAPHNTDPSSFTFTASAPAFEATEAVNGPNSVIYISRLSSGFDTVPVATTTIVVPPYTNFPTHPGDDVQHHANTPGIGQSIASSAASGPPSYGFAGNSTTEVQATGTSTASEYGVPGYELPSSSPSVSFLSLNSGHGLPNVTETVTNMTSTETALLPQGTTVAPQASSYGLPASESANYGFPPSVTTQGLSEHAVQPRRVCTLVDAGVYGTFCNRWDGSNTLPDTVWDSTVTPWAMQPSTTIRTHTKTTIVTPNPPASPPHGLPPSESPLPLTSSAPPSPPSPSPSKCGEVGAIDISFDDLPTVSTTDNSTATLPPIFNPFDHFFWGAGWSYAPPPDQPFLPENGTHLAVCDRKADSPLSGSPHAGTVPAMGFGAGPRNINDIYWFNAHTAYVGCDNFKGSASVTCDFVATAFQYDFELRKDKVIATQHFSPPPCPGGKSCQLTQIQFQAEYRNLSAMSFYARVGGNVVNFWMDSLELSWYNNTCAAGLARISSRRV